MRLIIISPYSPEGSIQRLWGQDIEDFAEKVLNRPAFGNIVFSKSIPEPTFNSVTEYLGKVALDIAALPNDEQIAVLYFCVGQYGEMVVGGIENILKTSTAHIGPTLMYADRPYQSEVANFHLYSHRLRGKNQMLESMGVGIPTLPPMPEQNIITVEDAELPDAEIFVALTTPSLDVLYPIVSEARDAHIFPKIQIIQDSAANAEIIEEFLKDMVCWKKDGATTKQPLHTKSHRGTIYIGDTYDVIGAMQRGAHVIVPFYAPWLFDITQGQVDFVAESLEDMSLKVRNAISAPRNGAVYTESPYSTEFKDAIRQVFSKMQQHVAQNE